MKRIAIVILCLGSLSCCCQGLKVKRDQKKVTITDGQNIRGSIQLFSSNYFKYVVIGKTIFYTDGILIPDQITLNLYKVDVTDLNKSHGVLIKSLNLEHDEFLRLKLKSDYLILVYKTDGERKRLILKPQLLFNEQSN